MGNQTTLVTAPTSQPTGLVFSNRTFTSVDYSFTSSGAANYLVLRKQGSAPSEVSVNATSYTVGALLGTATVVSAGSSTSGTDSGLTAGTAYFYVVFAFNGTGASATYLTTAPLSGNTSTLSIDTTPPTFTNSSTNPVSGLPFLVSVKVEDLESGVNASTVKLEHRSISSGVGLSHQNQ